jgi:hypothetical protein
VSDITGTGKNWAVRSSRIVLLSKCYLGDQIMKADVADFVARTGKKNCIWGVGAGTWREDSFEDFDVNMAVKLKCLLKK